MLLQLIVQNACIGHRHSECPAGACPDKRRHAGACSAPLPASILYCFFLPRFPFTSLHLHPSVFCWDVNVRSTSRPSEMRPLLDSLPVCPLGRGGGGGANSGWCRSAFTTAGSGKAWLSRLETCIDTQSHSPWENMTGTAEGDKSQTAAVLCPAVS